MTKKRWIGLDIGGANIKAADTDGWCQTVAFPLWQNPSDLAAQISNLLPQPDEHTRYALTMTGELADCFQSREEGVRHIIDATSQAIESSGSLVVYSVDGELLCGAEAKMQPDCVAAANWLCLSDYTARLLHDDETGILIDVGSTTTDIIPISSSGTETASRSDFDRLLRGELLYIGVQRTPLCAIVDSLPYRSESVPVMNELFATVDDCCLILQHTEAQPDDCATANGAPRTIEHAVIRLARMIGLDAKTFDIQDATVASQSVMESLTYRIGEAIKLQESADVTILSGHGSWLVPPFGGRTVRLVDKLGLDLARVAPAYALAVQAEERFG